MAKGKQFIGLVLTERQAKTLLEYVRMMRDHGAGRFAARDFRAIAAKLDRSLTRIATDRGGANG